METQIAPALVYYGPLGLLCLILMYAVIALYRSKDALQKAKDAQAKQYDERIDRLVTAHREEVQRNAEACKAETQQLMQRHITKAETWVEKGNELAVNLHAVLDSIVKRGD